MQLTSEIMYLPGVGPKKSKVLKEELNIITLDDLLSYYPYKYVDRSRFYAINELSGKENYVQLKGQLRLFMLKGEGRNQRLTAIFADATGTIELVWFKGTKFIQKQYVIGNEYIVYGKPSVFNQKLNIVHPEVEILTQETLEKQVGWMPSYGSSEKMKRHYLNSKGISRIMQTALAQDLVIEETLTQDVLEKWHLIDREKAVRTIHLPATQKELRDAEMRLKFEELFYIQLHIAQQSQKKHEIFKGFIFKHIGDYFNQFYKEILPFELTNAQKRVLKEIRKDMGSNRQMNRLLQGDVGSGKTIVALMTCLMALDNDFQACIVAPTEILAQQHYQSIYDMITRMGINVALLTGSTRTRERREIHEMLENGSLQILIGTHAVLEDKVKFQNLGVVIIDEQHRFGVAQRAKLWNKNTQPPHVLVMTATPIPRTLAMTIYGDLEVSVIDELPPGRKPIETYLMFENKRQQLNQFMDKQIQAGRQIYMVYPLIQESEALDFKDLEAGYELMQQTFPNYGISMVHGRLKSEEKEAEMEKFVQGKTQILMATTVIEVGVNVPNASMMVIESAERFGLSQLHQLRGRVGRGADQSYCVLMTKYELSSDSRKRLEILCNSNNGFEIAEADLNMRGPGEIDGTAQSGLPFDLKIAKLAHDGQILQIARDCARELIQEDPQLEKHALLKEQLSKLNQNVVDWSVIS